MKSYGSNPNRRGDLPHGGIRHSSPAGTLASTVHHRLRQEIVFGAFNPGQKLTVEFLGARYNVGASPVRDALNRLSLEGLVNRVDQRCFSVASVSQCELRELVDARCWVEQIALAQSIAHRDEAWEKRLVLAFHRLGRMPRSTSSVEYRANQEWEARHRAFHEALIANCRSRYLLRFCREMRDQIDRYRHLAAAWAYPGRKEDEEHKAIMDAAIAGRTEEASDLLVHHYRVTLTIVTAGGINSLQPA